MCISHSVMEGEKMLARLNRKSYRSDIAFGLKSNGKPSTNIRVLREAQNTRYQRPPVSVPVMLRHVTPTV